MKRLWSPLLPLLLLCCCLSGSHGNRVYVHPFHLFAAENVSCETLQTQPTKPVETVLVAPLDVAVLTPDDRDPSHQDGQRQNITERTAVLAELLNSLGLRMYQALSSKQQGANTLLSPVNTYGSLVAFYLGASKKTASSFQVFAIICLSAVLCDWYLLIWILQKDIHTISSLLSVQRPKCDKGARKKRAHTYTPTYKRPAFHLHTLSEKR